MINLFIRKSHENEYLGLFFKIINCLNNFLCILLLIIVRGICFFFTALSLQSYCQKHSRTNTKDKVGVGGSGGGNSGKGGSDSEDGEPRPRKRKDMTSEEKNQARAAKFVLSFSPLFTLRSQRQ